MKKQDITLAALGIIWIAFILATIFIDQIFKFFGL